MQPLIVDVREPHEYADTHVEGALNISSTEFRPGHIPNGLNNIDKNRTIILYCRSGGRAGRCQSMLSQMGFKNVINGINQRTIEAHI